LTIKYLDAKRVRGSSTAESTLTPVIDGSDTVLTFTESGTFTPAGSFNVEYLVVGGGGSGGFWLGGGGGAGAYRANGTKDHGVTAQAYTITVGAGGIADATTDTKNPDGDSSIFDTITSVGGGAGASHSSAVGSSAGSGGGMSDNGSAGTGGSYGNNGGTGTNNTDTTDTGGGGGGSASVGGNGTNQGAAGAGGTGTANDISGSSLYYAAGGGGGSGTHSGNSGGSGGSSIGGNGGGNKEDEWGNVGTGSTGSGGGGGAHGDFNVDGVAGRGGSGGSGIVIIRFVTSGNSYTATSGSTDEKATLNSFSDTAGTSADGTISGATHSTSSPPVGSGWLDFDGSNDYCTANGANFAITTTGSISIWFKFDYIQVSENDTVLIEFGDTDSNSYLHIMQDYTGRLNLENVVSGTTVWGMNSAGQGANSITATHWYQLVLTHNGKTATLWLGKLGEVMKNVTSFYSITTMSQFLSEGSIDNVQIGREFHSNGGGQYLDGGIAEVAMWNRVLTSAEIEKLHFNNDSPSGTPQPASTIPTGLRVHFPFDASGVMTNAAIISNKISENTVYDETDTRRNWFLQSGSWLSKNLNYGYAQGGGNTPHSIIDRFPFSTDTSATSVGTLVTGNYEQSSASDPAGGYSYLAGGKTGSTRYAYVQRHQNASSANSVQVGNAHGSGTRLSSGWHSLTHGYRAGGWSGSTNNFIKKYPFSTSANESDIADLSLARHRASQLSSATYGYMCGGHNNGTKYDRIDKHAFATSLDSVDVGNLEEVDYGSIGTYDLVGGNGYTSAGEQNDKKMQIVSFTTDQNATEVAQFSIAMKDQSCGASGLEHGYAASGYGIEKHTFDTTVLITGVGNLTTNRTNCAGTQG